ncbi:conserved hypothetical protein [Dinoroseobacter shibae DFL 12 = DSM 16493]|jgi:hypothetical protein|uniref:DUF3726 domain-containing protein n=1 Tax=Dinoroseobacter shibae (strain DSM 16493 / NCIMB 14021 / DFL 12) TaxID=398580 RepID=A8LPK4_DINSH|nr:DUF3726 domain-containing protein [Dinoroseobacter shibae]ABV92327.1 conserved hypothetical protein [Dinoroseobacter shibae DFL 12 = DSM 16493]URF47275.1 DUF3726 domain-containing protein [Dinoroseobacter shibae]URF51586.1 DUF3726 domain-containing protein [Dinoroseobacter shibae]
MSMDTEPHDQTRGETTPVFRDAQAAPLSCNEAASLCTKAARGAGMSWGMAEEAGFAVAWLVSRGIDGPSHLRAHLERSDGRAWSELCPSVTPGLWRNAARQPNCPIILGATLCDYATLPEGPSSGRTLTLGPVSAPLLLVPFLAVLAHDNHLALTLTWETGRVCIDDQDVWLQRAARALSVLELDLALTARAARYHHPCATTKPKAHTTADTVAALNTLAMRTTVPATEASRAGAGSTLSDND